MKKNRQMKVLEIISKHEVETQDELIELLRAEDYYVTQATISRDIRELDLIKISTQRGTYKYTVSSHAENEKKKTTHFGNALVSSLVSIDYAQNIIVVKTVPGMSNAIAIEIDRIHILDMLGCVAGDDTIIMVMRNEERAMEVSSRLRELLSGK